MTNSAAMSVTLRDDSLHVTFEDPQLEPVSFKRKLQKSGSKDPQQIEHADVTVDGFRVLISTAVRKQKKKEGVFCVRGLSSQGHVHENKRSKSESLHNLLQETGKLVPRSARGSAT